MKISASIDSTAEKQRIVVVLGMHRSGTSAITRGLEAMGVELGSQLMPPAEGNNDKGFFEDAEVNAINIDLLAALGQDWQELVPLTDEEMASSAIAPLRLRAIEVLRERFAHTRVFGLKDPRMARVLPFWQHVFAHLGLEEAYVIVLRNPLSVAQSLARRDHMPAPKAYYLWLTHMLPSVVQTRGRTRLVVDYDLLMEEPQAQVRRMARAIGLEDRLDEGELTAFAEQFLEGRLRHAAFRAEDLEADPHLPAAVANLFTALGEAAADRVSLEAADTQALLDKLVTGLGAAEPALRFQAGVVNDKQRHIVNIEAEAAVLRQAVHDKDVHIGNLDGELGQLRQDVRDKDLHIGNLDHDLGLLRDAVRDKDVHIGNLDRELAVLRDAVRDKDVHIGNLDRELAVLRDAVRDKDVHIGNIEAALGESEAESARLREAVRDKDAHIDHIEALLRARDAALAERAELVASLEALLEARRVELARTREEVSAQARALAHLQAQNVLLGHRVAQGRGSLAYALGKPVRLLRGVGDRLGMAQSLELIPLSQLTRTPDGWRSEGEAPAFLLQAWRAWRGLAGWHMLSLRATMPEPCEGRLAFDTGEGFSELASLDFRIDPGGDVRLPVYIPDNCVALRLQPCDRSMAFRLSACRLERLKPTYALERDFSTQAAVYERLGGCTGNATQIEPMHEVAPLDTGRAYRWRATGEDPYFAVHTSERLRPGWYMVEVQVHTDAKAGVAKLYMNYGAGFSESDAVGLPFESGVVAKRLVHLPSVPSDIRLDPVDGRSRFTVGRVHFAPVTSWFARDRMLKRLRGKSDRYSGLSNRQILRKIEGEARKSALSPARLLAQRYGATFVTSVLDNALGYQDWIETVERPAQPDVPAVLARIGKKRLISVIVPTYNTRADWLRACIDSVRRQSYPHWELCIADDASPQPHVREILADYAAKDQRIKFMVRSENGHISRASNSALELATGEYVALLDHDDELAEHALLFVAEAIDRQPGVQIIYTDEDKLNEKGERFYPHFKSDWNPDLFFAQNYVSHLGVYERGLITAIGGFRDGVEGSQDHDLLLRCLPKVQPGNIVHIPRVLYHWRTGEGSTARDHGQKSYALDAGLRALKDYFDVQGPPGVEVGPGLLPNTYRVRWPLPDPAPLVTLMIPTRDAKAVTEVAVRSILEKTSYRNYEILIIDNGSVEPATLDFFEAIQREDARVRVVRYDRPFNYSAINNFGETHARGTLLGLVNNDIEVIGEEWLTEMVSHACRPEIGCVGAKLYYSNDTIQHGGVILGLGGVAGHSHKHASRDEAGYFRRLKLPQTLSAVTAACLVVRRGIYQEVGGLDETNLEIAFNDVDFCLRVRAAGYRNLWTPYAELYHHESVSRGAEDTPQKMERFMKEVMYMKSRWQDALARDPYYNPNLTHARENFSI